MHKKLIVTLFGTLLAANAQAASIVNLADHPQTIVIEHFRQQREVTIPPYGRFETLAYPTYVKQGGDFTLKLEQYGSYALWPDGTLALQLRGRTPHGRGF